MMVTEVQAAACRLTVMNIPIVHMPLYFLLELYLKLDIDLSGGILKRMEREPHMDILVILKPKTLLFMPNGNGILGMIL